MAEIVLPNRFVARPVQKALMRYFDHGTVDLAFVKRDVAAYYKRWPERTYELLELRVLAFTIVAVLLSLIGWCAA